MQKDRDWLAEMAPVGPATAIDWGFLFLVVVGLVALTVLLVTYFLI